MKVLLISENAYNRIMDGDKYAASDDHVSVVSLPLQSIDIPEGCVLAVVAENAEKVAAAYPNVAMPLVSLIQEVKL